MIKKRGEDRKKVLICGAGSIGIFLGAKLYSKNHEIHLFGRRKLKEAGKKILIDNKEFEISKRLFSMPKNGEYDFIFITSKLYDLEHIVKLIHNNKVNGRIIASIQNGIVDGSKYKRILNKKLVPICVFGGFRIEKNNLISNMTSIGWLTENSKQGKEISSLLSQCRIPCRAEKKFESFRTEKMIVNCCLNALSAIEKKPFNSLFKNKETKKRIDSLFNECYEILKKEYPLDNKDKIKERMIKSWHNLNHYSSTYQDVVSGRKSEIDFFNGWIVKAGEKYNIDTVENKKILEDFKCPLAYIQNEV